ncbi:MAG: hypothetical protein M3380_20575 [Chloroflexota bacterium]|nr:hypothetical protein [Chloroflexota bacterium]
MSARPADAPVLVVLVNNHADWQRIVDEGWYRIPLKHAPQPVAASFLAFYQSRVFGADAFRVRFYAPVRRYQILTRRELLPAEPDHPRALDRYYRVELGPLQELERPIPSRRLRRITFIPTTLRRLREAAEINDLWIGDDVEEILWELFRDAGLKAERRLEIGEGRQRYVVPVAVRSDAMGGQGGVAIFCDGRARPARVGAWQIMDLAPQLVYTAPQACIKHVRALLEWYTHDHTRTG